VGGGCGIELLMVLQSGWGFNGCIVTPTMSAVAAGKLRASSEKQVDRQLMLTPSFLGWANFQVDIFRVEFSNGKLHAAEQQQKRWREKVAARWRHHTGNQTQQRQHLV